MIYSPLHANGWAHPVLAVLSNCCPGLWGRLLTCYATVRRWDCSPLDLHFLGTPQAFVLSQDQTLHQNADVKPTDESAGEITNLNLAHRHSVPCDAKFCMARMYETQSFCRSKTSQTSHATLKDQSRPSFQLWER